MIYWIEIFYFLPERIAITTIIITTAIAINMPKPIPTLKIPAIALQELKSKVISVIVNSCRKFFNFFCCFIFNANLRSELNYCINI